MPFIHVSTRVMEGLEDLLQKSNGFNIDQILFVIGNDILHTGNNKSTTTKGTHVDSQTSHFDAYIAAFNLYVAMTEMLLPIADVHVIHAPFNHDLVLGTVLANNLKSWFRNAENITFDVTALHRKYYRYGNSLIGISHSDGVKEVNLPIIMAKEAREHWANIEFGYWYLGHVHHRMSKEYIGVTVEYTKSPSSADAWHHKEGYIAKPACEAFIHSKTGGQVARLTSYCNAH